MKNLNLITRKIFLVTLILILGGSLSHAGIGNEITKTFKNSDSVYVDSYISVNDNESFDNNGDSISGYGAKGYVVKDVKNTAYVRLNQDVDSCFIDTFTFGVQLEILHRDHFSTIKDTVWLYVNYDTSLLQRNKEISSYLYNHGLYSKITILGFSNEQYKEYVEIGGTQLIERYRNLENSLITLSPISLNSTTKEIKFSWSKIEGAEEYDLEWKWIDAIGSDGALDPTDSFSVDFRFDATRVRTTELTYSISVAYPKGYIVAKIRPVGRNKHKPAQVIYGDWSNVNHSNNSLSQYSRGYSVLAVAGSASEKLSLTQSSGAIAGWPAHGVVVALDAEMNWQYVSTFAEEGKRKEVVSYYDGSLRNRQSVTRISTGMDIVVGETIYDYEGRPAVNILPVPSFTHQLQFHPNFNLSDVTGDAYDKNDFDSTDGSQSCGINVASLSITAGASKYYSASNNSVNERKFGYIPDANKFPMTVTEYMPDGTGRIRRQGGVGIDHQLGTGHETKYYYAVPGEQELDRLFGNAVGSYKHYQKR